MDEQDDDFGFNAFRPEAGLLDAVIGELGLVTHDVGPKLTERLENIASAYLFARFARHIDGDPSEQKEVIRDLVSKLDAVLLARSAIAPEYWATISGVSADQVPNTSILDPCEAIRRLRDAAVVFLSGYNLPHGPRPNIALEEAVRALRDCFEEIGIRLTFNLNKHGVGGPRANSPGASALVLLLRGLEPKLQVTAISNMLEKVRNQRQPSRSHYDAIWDADPGSALDASLLRRRRDD